MDEYRQRKEEIDIKLIRILSIQIMCGVVHLHSKGIAHHDLHGMLVYTMTSEL